MKYKLNGLQFDSISQIARHYEMSRDVLDYRLKKGVSLAEAVSMPKRVKPEAWSIRRLRESASKYHSKSDWRKNEDGAYQAWVYRGSPTSVVSHMRELGHRYKRCVYRISVRTTKLAYVGLTFNLEKRFQQHMRSKKFSEIAQLYGQENILIKQITDYLKPDEAAKFERKEIDRLKKNGFQLINSVKGGSLGGNFIKWTYEKVKTDLLKHSSFKIWRHKSSSAYTTALTKGWIARLLQETGVERQVAHKDYWTEERIKRSAIKFMTKSEWYKADNQAYHASKRLGVFDKVTRHMPKRATIQSKWSDNERVFSEAKKFKSRSQWQKFSAGSYKAAVAREIVDEACTHMAPKLTRWTVENVTLTAKMYKTKTEWQIAFPGAWQAGKRLGCFEKATAHMEIKWKKLWDKKSDVIAEAQKFSTRSSWQKGSSGSYAAARRNGWIDEATTHM